MFGRGENGTRFVESPVNMNGTIGQTVRDSARTIASTVAPLLERPGDHVEFAFSDLGGRHVKVVVEQG